MKLIRNYHRWLIVGVLFTVAAFTSVATPGIRHTEDDYCLVNISDHIETDADMSAYLSGVVYESSRQICTSRMGCRCKHRRSDTDTLKKHTPEENPYDDQNSWNPHLDIRCTKCNSDWYCPVFRRYRG